MIVCQSVINGILRNMSLLKTRLPGLLPSVECIPALIACMEMDSTSSTNSFASTIFVVVHHVIMFLGRFPLFGVFYCKFHWIGDFLH